MPVNLRAPDPKDLHSVAGLRIATVMAGVRKANRRDLVVFALEEGAAVAGVFTSNRFCAAPVQVCREHLGASDGMGGSAVRALVINTGNANAGTGADGLARARSTCAALAKLLGVKSEQVLPFSTGVIMETLPNERIEAALPAALVAAGFAEESRLQLLACTPATYQPAAERARLRVIALDRGSPIEALRESLDTNARGFNPDAEPTSLAEAADFRGRIADGRLFTAYLDGQAAGAGMYTTPIDGLCELVGIATLEPFRRQGVATALTSYAARVAFEHGVGTAFLSAADAQAGRVYERVGFRPFATMLSFVG